MKRRYTFALSVVFVALFLFSCKENKQKEEAGKMIREWLGKEIRLPENIPCFILGRDTISGLCTGLFQKEYKLLLYVDSTGCSSCRLMLDQWKQLIEESDSLFSGKLGFLFYFQPKNIKDMKFLFLRDNFDFPVFMDLGNQIDHLNHFPQNPNYQCFLLDKDNKVLTIGNPVLNPKIRELYQTLITGKKNENQEPKTTATPDKIIHDFGTIRKGNKKETTFSIKNTGKQPLLIERVSASCGCTRVDWDKQPADPGKATRITVEMTPDETGYFNKTIEVFGNMELSPVKFTITGMVVE